VAETKSSRADGLRLNWTAIPQAGAKRLGWHWEWAEQRMHRLWMYGSSAVSR